MLFIWVKLSGQRFYTVSVDYVKELGGVGLMTDLCRWPGWGGAAAAPWRSLRAAPLSAGPGADRTGRCEPGPSGAGTPNHLPSPDPTQLSAPPVWGIAAPRCLRRQEEQHGTSRACRRPDLWRRESGGRGQRSATVSAGPPEVRVCYMIREGQLQKQKEIWTKPGNKKCVIFFLFLVGGKKVRNSRAETVKQTEQGQIS